MFCKNCGNEVEEAKFCSVCGAPMEEAPVAESVVEPVAEPVVEIAPEAVDPGKTLGLVSMIVGIASAVLSVPCSCMSCAFLIPLFAGIVGIVLGAIGIKKSKDAGFDNKQAKIGLILSIVAIVLVVIIFVLAFIGGFAGGLASSMGY